jgi:ABC-type iron transport system FetAB ATPase subunit
MKDTSALLPALVYQNLWIGSQCRNGKKDSWIAVAKSKIVSRPTSKFQQNISLWDFVEEIPDTILALAPVQ